jgi:hypothetical protein
MPRRKCQICGDFDCECRVKVYFGRSNISPSGEDTRRPYKPDQIRVERDDWDRASGDCVCTICDCVYYDHAPVVGYAWLRKLCDGRLVKL